MKKLNILSAVIITSILFLNCNRIDDDDIVRYDPNNKHPIANAGFDQEITLSDNKVVLNGSASLDADGYINLYQWTNISTHNCIIKTPTSAQRIINGILN